MSMIRGVHHINLLVRDLDEAMARYRSQLGVESFLIDTLEGRGVRTARFRAGDVWIVLVEPVADGEPMRQLTSRGEGLFLLSFEVDSLEHAQRCVAAGGGGLVGPVRRGLDDWSVVDINPETLCGAPIQLTQTDE